MSNYRKTNCKEYFDSAKTGNIDFAISRGEYARAKVLLDNYEQEYPQDVMCLIYRARLELINKNIQRAEELCITAIETGIYKNNAKITAYTLLGDIKKYEFKYDEAIENYKYALDIGKDRAISSALKLAELYKEFKQYDDSYRILNMYKYDSGIIDIKKAEIEYELGRISRSLEILLKVKDYGLTSFSLQEKYFNLGKCYYYTNETDKSIESFQKTLVGKSPYYYKSKYYLAKLYLRKDMYDQAITNIKEYLSKQPDDDGYIVLVRIYLEKLDFKSALITIKNIKNPDMLNYMYGLIEEARGNYDTSLKYLYKFVSTDAKSKFKGSIITIMLIYIKKYINESDSVKKDIIKQNINSLNGYVLSNLITEKDKILSLDIKTFISKINNEELNINLLPYSARQIYSYDEDLAKKHVRNHHVLDYFDNKTKFDNIDIDILFDDIKSLMTKDRLISSDFFDKYLIPYNSIGHDKLGNINTIKVISNPGTKEIITMYPTSREDAYLNTNEEREFHPKVRKKLSAIEKFNLRYNSK